jgi:hypothetical protein
MRAAVSRIPAELLDAYRSTTYRIELPARRRVDLKIGRRSAALARLLRESRAACGAFLTACNPLGRICSAAENAAAQATLQRELLRLGYRCLPGVGLGVDPGWPPERSVFAMGLSRAAARRLAQRYRQLAFVFARAGAPVELVLLA